MIIVKNFIDPLDQLLRIVSAAQGLAYNNRVDWGHKLLIQALDLTSVSEGKSNVEFNQSRGPDCYHS